ncbi:proton channel OTOP2 isoform X2 [Amia ocellicauda]|uniref:proton channel OTOP2 isoform X2 n=1 Tax=Amia ocellicauda TaxID=2972642 RepID=UPI003464B7C2
MLPTTDQSKEMESEEKCASTLVSMSHDPVLVGDSQSSLPVAHTSIALTDNGRKWGRLLSGIIAVNIIFLGSALVAGGAFSDVNISDVDVQIFLIILLLLTTCWMLYYVVYNSRWDHTVLYKDSHAGPIWLRGGLVAFGVCSLIMDVFKLTNYVGYAHCDSAVKITFPVVQAVFLIMQTYFLWVHAKDCVQTQRNLTRCGLMLALTTNLMVWIAGVTEESLHQTVTNKSVLEKAAYSNSSCKCKYDSCKIFETGYYYLYPFNIEYSLFASCMTYVMWKNVGRVIDDHVHHHVKFRIQGILVGPILGVMVMVAGLVVFIFYEVDVGKEERKNRALLMYYVMNIIGLTLMSIASLIGSVMLHLKKGIHVSGKNPIRSLDIFLLLGASFGHFIICYFTVVAVVASKGVQYLNTLNLVCSLITIIELCLQNAFIIEGLHREPYHEPPAVVDTIFVNQHAFNSQSQKGKAEENPSMDSLQPNHNPVCTTHSTPSDMSSQPSMSWRRRVVKEVSAFLLFCNIIFWIMPAFGARPEFDNNLGENFYNSQMWVPIVNIGLPFGIFYRMHSVAGLFEVFHTS